jgi:cell division septation protein DedD
LALIVIVVATLIALMGRGDAPAVSSSDPADDAPVELSAARSADADMAAATPDAGDAAEVSEPTTSEGAVPGGTGGEPDDPTPVDEGGVPTATREDATEEGTPSATGALSPSAIMRFGLTINAHERATAAQEQSRDLQARFPSLQFVLVPVQVGGANYYRVVAGPAESRGHAEAIRAELAGYIGTAVARGAIVRSTRVAFLLGEYDSLDEAMARRGQAEDAGIPAYFAEYGPPEGPLRYRVYAGAYANAREASHLQTLLIESGLTGAILTERMGRPLR